MTVADVATDEPRQDTQLAKSGLIAFAGSVINGIAAFAVIVAITRGIDDKATSGLVFTAIALFNIVFAIAALGADVGLVRYVSQNRSSAAALTRTAAVPAFVTSSLAGVGLALFRKPLAAALANGGHEQTLQHVLLAMAPFIPAATLATVFLATTRGLGTMVPTAIADRISKPTAQLVLVVTVSLLGAGPTAVTIAWATSFALSLAVASRWLARLVERPGSDEIASQDYWRFTRPQAATNVLFVLLRWADVLLVASLAGSGPAAVYTAVTRLLIAGNFVNGAVVQAVSPLVSAALGDGDRHRAADLLKSGTAWLVAAVWPGYLVLAVVGGPLLAVFGEGYGSGATALTILSLAMMVASAVGPIEAVLLMDGGSRLSLMDNAIAVTVMLAIDVALVPRIGIRGAAIGWAVGLLITNLGPLVQVRRRIGITPFGRAHTTACLIAIAAVGVPSLVLRATGQATVATTIGVAVVGYAIHVAILSRFSELLRLHDLGAALRRR